jgi:hypothetical protein
MPLAGERGGKQAQHTDRRRDKLEQAEGQNGGQPTNRRTDEQADRLGMLANFRPPATHDRSRSPHARAAAGHTTTPLTGRSRRVSPLAPHHSARHCVTK